MVLSGLYFLSLGERPFATPDEGRYVEIPREMLANNDFITPRLNGVKYFEKPPLFYWVVAGFQKMFGISETVMRLPVVLFSLLGLLGTYFFTRRYEDEDTALLATLILGSSVLYFSLSRLIVLDMAVSVLVSLSGLVFFHATQQPAGIKRRLWMYAFAGLCALGVMTKGLMALAVMGPVILIWATITGSWKSIFPAYIPTACLIFLAIALPWHVLASFKNPEFAYKYFVYEHFIRYTTTEHMRYQPLWFFIPILFVGFLPWSFFMSPQMIQRHDVKSMFLGIWALWVFVFFSISNSKLIPYILPMFVPVSILLATHMKKQEDTFKIGIAMLIIGFCVLIYLTCFSKTILPYALHILSVLLMGMGGLFCTKRWHGAGKIFVLAAGHFVVLFLMIHQAEFFQRPSVKAFVPYIHQHQQKDVRLVSFMTYFQDLPVYANQVVHVLEAKGELEFGTTVEDTSSWMMDRATFDKMWEKEHVLALGRRSEIELYHSHHPHFVYQILYEQNGLLLIKNF